MDYSVYIAMCWFLIGYWIGSREIARLHSIVLSVLLGPFAVLLTVFQGEVHRCRGCGMVVDESQSVCSHCHRTLHP